jgi:tubulin alpha
MPFLKSYCITGANRGIGLELVQQLAAKDGVEKIYALCRSAKGSALKATSKVQVIEGIDVSKDDVVEKLQAALPTGTTIESVIHNAGSFGPPEKFDDHPTMYASQSLGGVTMDRMRYTFELNSLGPLRVTQALLAVDTIMASMKQVIIITSLMGSMTDNTSGGIYAYRTSKAAVNMIGTCLAQDLKKDGISVGLVHPGAVQTGFGNAEGKDWETKRFAGQRGVTESTKGVLDAMEKITLENTGAFLHGNYGEGVKELAW